MLEAVNEIRPPLIAATLAVIVSFLPHVLHHRHDGPVHAADGAERAGDDAHVDGRRVHDHAVAGVPRAASGEYNQGAARRRPRDDDPDDRSDAVKQTFAVPLLLSADGARCCSSRVAGLDVPGRHRAADGAGGRLLAATRHVPLKMLPFDNKNELQLVLDIAEGTTLERTDAAVREFERLPARRVPEVTDFTSYVGAGLADGLQRPGAPLLPAPAAPNVADIRVNLVGKKSRAQQSHAHRRCACATT